MTLDPATPYLHQWNHGSQQSLYKALELHMDWIRAQVRRHMTPALRAKAQSMDFVQEALLDFLREAPRFTIPNGRAFRGLLYRIVLNVLRAEYRWWNTRKRSLTREFFLTTLGVQNLVSPEPGAPEDVDLREKIRMIRLGMEFLLPGDQRVILLKDEDGLSFVEIGEQLHKDKDAARMQYKRAVERLAGIVGMVRRGEIERLLEPTPEDEVKE